MGATHRRTTLGCSSGSAIQRSRHRSALPGPTDVSNGGTTFRSTGTPHSRRAQDNERPSLAGYRTRVRVVRLFVENDGAVSQSPADCHARSVVGRRVGARAGEATRVGTDAD